MCREQICKFVGRTVGVQLIENGSPGFRNDDPIETLHALAEIRITVKQLAAHIEVLRAMTGEHEDDGVARGCHAGFLRISPRAELDDLIEADRAHAPAAI